jgi:hypothetical protein
MKRKIHLFLALSMLICSAFAQPITGVWRGKIKTAGKRSYQLELKLIRNVDSLTGTAYYYNSDQHYSRFLVKGFIDPSGEIIWWDDLLIERKGSPIFSNGNIPIHFEADFNCPGEDIMKLDGTGDNMSERKTMEVHLDKMKSPFFPDEWDDVIDNFPYYANDPALIDSIAHSSTAIAVIPPSPESNQPPAKVKKEVGPPAAKQEKVITPKPVINPEPVTIVPKTVEEKFIERKKVFTTEIPLSGDSISLDFYDHAEIDGDSIALFLNGKMLYQHILLKAAPFRFKLAVSDLAAENEMIMVAENLGSIPPNTSLMIAWCNGQRYEARLESTENSSAMIRFIKPVEPPGTKR